MRRNEPCWCKSGKKWKYCHFPKGQKTEGPLIKTLDQIGGVRRACQMAALILKELQERAQIGTALQELDDYSKARHKELGAIPAPLAYGHPPFPGSICTSLNEVICHGIPDQTRLKMGDILNIDVTVQLDGFFGDCSAMVCLMPCADERTRVVQTSRECLDLAIAILGPEVRVGKIGQIIQKHAHSRNCSVVDAFVGHGTGLAFHEPPNIPHFANESQVRLLPGMIFTIEPMINAGVKEAVIDPLDGWTARTKDGRASAQWEHTILITQKGCEVLTLPSE